MESKIENIYDIIILGGGIAGLYSAYKLSKRSPTTKILLLEKENVLGGRVKTYKDKLMQVEAGAGRFHSGHKLYIALLKELGLAGNMFKLGKDNIFYDVRTKMPIENPNVPLIKRLIENFDKVPVENMRMMTVLEYATRILSPEEISVLKETFGYYTELVTMNAHDCLSFLKDHLSVDHTFYVLKGGMNQVIDKLEESLLKNRGVKILLKHSVSDIHLSEGGDGNYVVSCHRRKLVFVGKKIISALPKQVLEKIPYFKPIHNVLKHSIYCGPLCRIYSAFPKGKDGRVWFDDLNKFTTNNNLRIVIPIRDGVIMTSYTDNKYAKFWKNLYEKGGVEAMNRELLRLMEESTGIKNIPQPIETNIFYWDCGVGYWTVGTDSKEISEKIIQPLTGDNIFICGEHFSEKNQQWIEGALDTSERVMLKI